MSAFLSARALNNVIKLGVASIITGSVVNSTLYNGRSHLFKMSSLVGNSATLGTSLGCPVRWICAIQIDSL